MRKIPEYTARIVSDSIGAENGVRLVSVEIGYPRIILPELNTHRVLSKNGASSRAIPMKRMIEHILENPNRPLEWLSNQAGMQGGAPLPQDVQDECDAIWDETMLFVVKQAERLAALGVHKQHGNRLLEPFMMTRTLITSTKWANFFKLRNHKDAQPEFKLLAEMMADEFSRSQPEIRRNSNISEDAEDDRWHLPFITDEERYLSRKNPGDNVDALNDIDPDLALSLKTWACTTFSMIPLLITSVARSARVSGKTFDGSDPDFASDVRTFQKLYTDPLHATPFEHQACVTGSKQQSSLTGNFHGWNQFRKFLPNEALDEARHG